LKPDCARPRFRLSAMSWMRERSAIIAAMNRRRVRDSEAQEELEKEREYFRGNAERMRYAKFGSQGLFVGSGVVEAGLATTPARTCLAEEYMRVHPARAIQGGRDTWFATSSPEPQTLVARVRS
jgi:hypothetical protein